MGSMLNDPELGPGERRYMYSIARIYSTSQMKQLKKDQYSQLLFRELAKGYHSPYEYERYFSYLNSPRKTQFGKLDTYNNDHRSQKGEPEAVAAVAAANSDIVEVETDEKTDEKNDGSIDSYREVDRTRSVETPQREVPSPTEDESPRKGEVTDRSEKEHTEREDEADGDRSEDKDGRSSESVGSNTNTTSSNANNNLLKLIVSDAEKDDDTEKVSAEDVKSSTGEDESAATPEGMVKRFSSTELADGYSPRVNKEGRTRPLSRAGRGDTIRERENSDDDYDDTDEETETAKLETVPEDIQTTKEATQQDERLPLDERTDTARTDGSQAEVRGAMDEEPGTAEDFEKRAGSPEEELALVFVRLELVCVSRDEDVDIKLTLHHRQALHIAPWIRMESCQWPVQFQMCLVYYVSIVKTHNLAYIECETLQAIFSKDLCPNKLTAPAKLLCEAVVNFQTTQEEITLTLRPDNVSLKNYLEDEPDPTKVVHTELSLVPEEFDQYQVGVDTDITFCLKELRAILAFAETAGLPLNIHFETAGRPVTFCVDGDQTFEASFVLATLAEADQSSSQQSQVKRPAQTSSASQQRSRSSASVRDARRDGGAKETHMRHGPSTSRKNESPRVDSSQQNGSSSQPPHPAPAADDAVADISAEELAAAMEMECEWEERPADRRQSDGQDAPSLPGDTAGRGDTSPEQGPSSPVIPVQSAGMSRVHDGPRLQPLENDETDEGDNLDDTIPGTPPAKKFRSLFFGSSQASTQPTQPLQQSTVLAADTDEESS
nr:hypothetical protein BaRGS_007785 [Batillaria attramentaria]